MSDVTKDDEDAFTKVNTTNIYDKNNFYDLDMVLDEQFEGDTSEIEEGTFISFKYHGEYSKGRGPPMNPKVSIHINHLLAHLS